ncbi:MAG: TetR-like C-terminal domain-containing protein [Acutalibacteraceae bacterium]|nr:TetR-like C-terminal domain-containing protein [Acutalibacteraceae bacterium]
MPPKVKVTKEDIISAAVDIVRESGAEAINARTVASVLNCSTQPVFSNFATMDELRLAVLEKADILCKEYISREVESGEFPIYKASGMAYIRFAKEEKELFKLLYMRDRSGEFIDEGGELNDQMESIVRNNTGLSGAAAKLFHLEMWAYVHGIATMFATSFFDLEWELVSKMLTDSYQGLRKQYGME